MNSNQIKLIAIIAMTIDHLTWTIWPGTQHIWYIMVLHGIGRLTAPIMWFFIAEGCVHTRNIWKYAGRLAAFAVISHFAYCFGFGIPFFDISAGIFNRTSVLWPLFLAVLLIAIFENTYMSKTVQLLVIIGFCLLAFPADWSSIALIVPYFIYSHRGKRNLQLADIVLLTVLYAGVYFFFLDRAYGILQMAVALSVPILMTYNGERGKWKGMKWLFYIYYPAHLVGVGVLRLVMHGNISSIF